MGEAVVELAQLSRGLQSAGPPPTREGQPMNIHPSSANSKSRGPRTKIGCARRWPVLILLIVLLLGAPSAGSAEVPDFSAIFRLFDDRCIECHEKDDYEAGLILETYESLMKGGETGVAIVPGKSAESLLMKYLRGEVREGREEKGHAAWQTREILCGGNRAGGRVDRCRREALHGCSGETAGADAAKSRPESAPAPGGECARFFADAKADRGWPIRCRGIARGGHAGAGAHACRACGQCERARLFAGRRTALFGEWGERALWRSARLERGGRQADSHAAGAPRHPLRARPFTRWPDARDRKLRPADQALEHQGWSRAENFARA